MAKGIQNIDPQTHPNNQNNLFYQDIEQQKSQQIGTGNPSSL